MRHDYASIRFIPARAGNTAPRRSWTGRPSVHPRSRGEHAQSARRVTAATGSSPLARGTLRPQPPDQIAQRFIPARAGNTSRRRRSASPAAVHPRSRGEHCATASYRAFRIGSSPLARGTRHSPPSRMPASRFIPARAGNTCRRLRMPSTWPVHPRSRGEHRSRCFARRFAIGSSPLARGTPWPPGPSRSMVTVHPRSRGEHFSRPALQRRSNGSSPLARGTRAGRGTLHRADPVHPRSRGEHAFRFASSSRSAGSSPLARGTPPEPRRDGHDHRFIPARAGNTGPEGSTVQPEPVHPRSRGEHGGPGRPGRRGAGSSPLARGTPPPHVVPEVAERFIPARAGNTSPVRVTLPSLSVHPRSRGEHQMGELGTASANGSSPLARGTPAPHRGCSPVVRFIPARAGNTSGHRAARRPRPVHPRSRGEHTSG